MKIMQHTMMYNKHVSWSAVQVPHRILFSRAELSKKSYIAFVRITQTTHALTSPPPEAEGSGGRGAVRGHMHLPLQALSLA